MRFRVESTQTARDDAKRSAAWIAKESPRAAVAWYSGLEHAILSLHRMPERCALAEESLSIGVPIRQMIFKSYRVLFMVRGRTVFVVHIRHAAMKRATAADLRLAGES